MSGQARKVYPVSINDRVIGLAYHESTAAAYKRLYEAAEPNMTSGFVHYGEVPILDEPFVATEYPSPPPTDRHRALQYVQVPALVSGRRQIRLGGNFSAIDTKTFLGLNNLDLSGVEPQLHEVIKFAVQNGVLKLFMRQLHYLNDYGGAEAPKLTQLLPDFAPYSFRFVMYKQLSEYEYGFYMNGGLIYSGPGQPSNGSFPSLTVSLDEDAASGRVHAWTCHT